jgi:hypothetical protein
LRTAAETQHAFGEQSRRYRVPETNGLLNIRIAGTGKSLKVKG